MNAKPRRADPADFRLPNCGVDTHAHLDMEQFDSELDVVLERSRRCGVSRIGNVFLGPGAYIRNRHLFAPHPDVFFLLGIHPHDASTLGTAEMTAMARAFADDPRLKAVGEIGLDFYYDHSPRHTQRTAFQEQLLLARELDLPAVIHSRDADEEVVNILTAMGFKDRPVLWHCFGGNAALAERIISLGWSISIPGTVTFRKSTELQEAVARIPLESMVIETDCPFLAPEPYRGKRNEPALTVFTAARIAEIKGLSHERVWARCGRNALSFFGLTTKEDSCP